jgi:hypothetical protein
LFLLSFHKLFRRIIPMPRNKSSQSNKIFSAKKSSRTTQKNNSNYQSLYLWVSFLWSLISLEMMNQKVEAQTLSVTLDLGALMSNQGVVLQGASASDWTGYSVSNAGDVNGDGKVDILVGAEGASPQGRLNAGAVYLIYGSTNFSAMLDLNTTWTATQGMVIQGGVSGDQAGTSVRGVGDVNGDGMSDLMVGAYRTSSLRRTDAGAAYIIYGSKTLPAILDLNITLTTAQGMIIQWAAYDNIGSSISGAGDVSGDGISDLLVAVPYASPLNRTQAGVAYLIYGSRSLPAVLDLNTTLTATQGMVIQGGMSGDNAGHSVNSAGDVNGDGISDLLIGAYYASPQSRSLAGAAYLIYGSKTLPAVLDLNTLNLTQGMVIQGAAELDQAGISVSSAGDINGDTIPDLLVGADYASPLGRTQAGTAYLIYGSKTLPAILDLNTLTGALGMIIQGAAAEDFTGNSVSSAGDMNGDGINDLVVGAVGASPVGRSSAGAAYLIYGSRTLSAVLDLNAITVTQGLVIQGAAAIDNTGCSVSSAGDMNGDNISDLVLGAFVASPLGRFRAGAAYVIYGKAFNAMSLMTMTTLSTTTKNTIIIPLSINTSTSTTSLGTISHAVITTSTMATGITVGETAPSPSTGAMTTASQMSPSLQSGSTISSVHSMGSTTLRSGDATTTTDIHAQAATTTGENSGVKGTVIGAAAGGVAGGITLTACLAAIGFYAYRKKLGANQSSNSASNNDSVALKDKNTAITRSNYGKIDENKKNEKEYEEVPKLEI